MAVFASESDSTDQRSGGVASRMGNDQRRGPDALIDKDGPLLDVFAAQHAQVGDGFFVMRALPLTGESLEGLEPFLILDHAPPRSFGPTKVRRGVGEHPHRGFQTVTLVYEGDLKHRDSAGNKGVLKAGDVQWMHAGSGLVHEELHGDELTENGGRLEMIQLWINLPAAVKMSPPTYADIRAADFPVVPLAKSGANYVRLIAGRWGAYLGPAKTASPLTLADLYLEPDTETTISLDPAWNTGLYLRVGALNVNGKQLGQHFMARLRGHGELVLRNSGPKAVRALFLSGKRLLEPIAAQGPFVMNTQAEVAQAVRDFQAGLLGRL